MDTQSDDKLNPELEAQLSELTEISCECLKGEAYPEDRVQALAEAMVRSGGCRKLDLPLGEVLKSRMKETCRDDAMHRGAEITAITDRIQDDFRQASEAESHPANS